MPTNHMPWDNGAIADTFDSIIGFHVQQKTTKTRCNKRVKMSLANHKEQITCPDCLVDIKREQEFTERLKAECEKYGKGN